MKKVLNEDIYSSLVSKIENHFHILFERVEETKLVFPRQLMFDCDEFEFMYFDLYLNSNSIFLDLITLDNYYYDTTNEINDIVKENRW